MNQKTIERIAIVVGETSGDILGAGLIEALQQHFPLCHFEGIGGERMLALGFNSLYPMERLAVMGLVEPLKRLPELLSIRKNLRNRYWQNPPDIFIGIDAPDFNLGLEEALHKKGIFTAHYVSPSVWAWRQGRVKHIARSVDIMLTLFPFEAQFYHEHNVNVAFVGHPLADKFPLESQQQQARETMGLDSGKKIVALLPGSRKTEVEKLARDFLQTANLCYAEDPTLEFLLPAANNARREQIEALLKEFPGLPVTLSVGNSHDVMAASDVVLMASGTTTLEAMLLKRPMVIAYRVANLTYRILKSLVKVRYIGLPNLLAGKAMVPEFIQSDVTPENLTKSVMHYLQDESARHALQETFVNIHQTIKKNASVAAAHAIVTAWQNKSGGAAA